VGLTDSTGALVGNETYQYDPYGQLIVQPHTAALRTNAWRYASGYYDVSTGLYKFGIRYYDATTGRWTQRDPVGGSLTETNKVNPYVYAGDDPVDLVDPSGRTTALAYCAGAAAIAAAIVIIPLVVGLIASGAWGLIFFALVILPYDSDFVVSLVVACLGGAIGGIIQDAIG
jgi:RHS repeat-associated protein